MPHFVYIIECVNGSFYTGYTTDVKRRYKEHQQGLAKCRYTRAFPPKKLLAYWEYETRSEALKVEAKIKKKTKDQKLNMIKNEDKKNKTNLFTSL